MSESRPFPKIRPYAVAVGAAVLLIVGIHGLDRDRFAPVGPGALAPEYSAVDLDGTPVSISQLSGEVVLLNIWATWCPPCREEMPSMQRLYDRLGPEGLRVVAVSIDAPLFETDAVGRTGGDVAAFVEEYGLTFDVWLDPSGGIQRTYRTTGVPESFVIDRGGRIIRKVAGSARWDDQAYLELFQRLLGEGR